MLRTLEAISRTKYVPPYAMALISAGLGQRESAFTWLERAYDARDVHLIYLTEDAMTSTALAYQRRRNPVAR